MKRNDDTILAIALGALGILLIMAWLSSCATQKRCNAKYPPQVEVHTETITNTVRRDSIIQGATVTNTIWRDSIITMEINKWNYIKDTTGRTELRYYRDAFGNLQVQCEAKDVMIERMSEVINSKESNKQTKVIEKERMTWYGWLIIGVLLVLLIKKYLHL